ncbi:hypothetical protein XU18_3667 [Perkinsela sp. CCAP 1560/4]|nr:hypothetical protein XU18_3667 [Perkinsela sp. CCAP 1560/4]|eukprot:KNH05263.1 hypothetical protein XU18_3667 [Perkinsela sp. CCAP 1560/4]
MTSSVREIDWELGLEPMLLATVMMMKAQARVVVDRVMFTRLNPGFRISDLDLSDSVEAYILPRELRSLYLGNIPSHGTFYIAGLPPHFITSDVSENVSQV